MNCLDVLGTALVKLSSTLCVVFFQGIPKECKRKGAVLGFDHMVSDQTAGVHHYSSIFQ